MKGKSKYIVPLLLAGMTTATGLVTTVNQQQQIMVQADQAGIDNIAGAELKLTSGFDDIYQLGKAVAMPTVVVSGGEVDADDLVYTIKRGSKVVAKLGAGDSFTPTYTGAYSVTIEAKKDNVVVSSIDGLTIMVEKTDAVINLPTNSRYVIPAQIEVNQEGFKVPAPEVEVLDEDGEPVDSSKITGTLSVELIAPSDTYTLELKDDGENEPYYAVKDEDSAEALADEGTYQIRYSYVENGATISRLESNFQVVEDLEVAEKLYIKLQSSVPSTGNVKTDISVPKVTVLDSATSTDGINAHLTITYTKINDDGTLGTPKEIDYENYTFCPEEEGNYVLSYSADIELFGIKTDGAYKPSTIIKVTDNKAPTVRPTYNYTVANSGGSYTIETINGVTVDSKKELSEQMINRKSEVPSVVIAGQEFSLPAIWGEDNFSDWQDITFTREIVGNSIPRKTWTSVLASDGVEAENPANEPITGITLSAGNYEIRYIAKDAAGKQVRATYSLVVKDADEVSDAKTDVKLSVGVSSITNKEKLTFNKPTASDTYDSDVDIKTYYELYTADKVTKLYTSEPLTKTNSDGKYELDIKTILTDYSTAGYLRVVTEATTDKYYVEFDTEDEDGDENTTEIKRVYSNVATAEKYVKLIKADGDLAAPTFAIDGVEVIGDDYATAWNNALLNVTVDDVKVNQEKLVKANGKTDIQITGINSAGYAIGKNYVDNVLESGDAHTFTIDDGTELLAGFDQGKDSIQIPSVTFTDTDENLKIKLTIMDRLGNIVSKDDYETITKSSDGDDWNYTISGASFKMSSSGVYTVTFRAEDVAGNVTVRAFGIRVNDKTAPTIVIEDEDKFGGDVEIGDFFEVPVGNLIKDGVVQENRDVEWQVYGGQYVKTSTGFYPLESGTYYIKYYGTDGSGNMQLLQDDSLFYINAKDTTAPVFNDDSSVVVNPTMAWNPETVDDVEQMTIQIPVVYATDPIRNDSVDVTCTVTGPDGSSVKLSGYDDADDDIATFVAKKQGKYTIKYEATDSANNTVSMTKVIALGDCIAPTIEWQNGYKVPTTLELNSDGEAELELKLGDNYFKVSDNESDTEYLTDNMKIKLVKPDGTTELTSDGSAGKNYKWTLKETGSYTLSIVVEDEAGMSNTYKYTIEVPDQDADENTVSPVVGTVLVVVSVVILAGVVIYFVVSSKKKATVKGGRTRKKND